MKLENESNEVDRARLLLSKARDKAGTARVISGSELMTFPDLDEECFV